MQATLLTGGAEMPVYWNKTVTLLLRKESDKKVQWEKLVFFHCFFKHIRSSEFDEKSRINGESYVVRIPCSTALAVPRGSIAVLGEIPDTVEENTSGNEILKKYGNDAFKVNTVSDNTGFYMPHIRIGN